MSTIPIEVLIEALIARQTELFLEENHGLLISPAFELRKVLGATVCVDGIPYKHNAKGKIELMAIRRNSGAYPDKLVLEGGTIAKGESTKDALKRHFREDFGVEIEIAESPFDVTQYRKEKPDNQWMQDPGKEHNVGPVYLIQILGEVPSYSQMGSMEWFSEEQMPPDEEFGYTNERIYRKAFRFIKRRCA
ncbi:MAG: DUF4916 domain-containing protein [Parcubacteria group bacterium]